MCDICGDSVFALSQKQRIQLTKDLNIGDVVGKAIDQLHDGKAIDKTTKKALWASHNAPLQKAVEEGYGKPLAKIEYGTPNYEFLKQLQTNTAVFAMFKNHASIKDMAALLKDADGNLRSKADFKTQALKVDADYRGNKLDVEYDTAVRQARMASQWAKYQKNKRLYPNLRYLLTKAAKPDEKHLKFVGIVRPVDDPWWDAHYPPNRWRCQCSVEQTDDEETDIPGNLPAIPDEFAFNSGKTGQIFDTAKCDYLKAASPKEQQQLIKQAKNYFNTDIAAKEPYQTFYKSKNGAKVEVHPLTYMENDIDNLTRNARALANDGHQVKILPSIIKDNAIRDALLPKEVAAKTKTPDYIVDEKSFDLKVIRGNSKNTISHQFSKKDQADNLLIEIPESFPFSKYQLEKMIKNHLKANVYKGEVWLNYKGDLLKNIHKKRD